MNTTSVVYINNFGTVAPFSIFSIFTRIKYRNIWTCWSFYGLLICSGYFFFKQYIHVFGFWLTFRTPLYGRFSERCELPRQQPRGPVTYAPRMETMYRARKVKKRLKTRIYCMKIFWIKYTCYIVFKKLERACRRRVCSVLCTQHALYTALIYIRLH